jgi:CheY-like chemotaxis protein
MQNIYFLTKDYMYEYIDGRVVKKDLKKEKGIYTSIIYFKDIFNHTFKLAGEFDEEELIIKAEETLFNEATLDFTKEYKINYKFQKYDGYYLVDAFIVEVDKLKEEFSDILDEFKYIDFISAAPFGVGQGKLDRSKITGITKLENGEIMLILDLESIVEEMGLFESNLEIEEDKIEKFSGLVLLVDDSATAIKIEKDALEKMGFEVVEAKNGEEGLQKLEELYSIYGDGLKNKLKLILSDVEMPKMDGYHMAAKIHNDDRFKEIPLIFSSSISDAFSDERGKEIGAEGYLVKFNPNKFYQSIADVIKNSNKE